MPLSLQQILDQQDTLAEQFETYEPSADDERDPDVFRALLSAASHRATAEAEIAKAVAAARDGRYSWAMIGGALGTTGQSAQQRYGRIIGTAR